MSVVSESIFCYWGVGVLFQATSFVQFPSIEESGYMLPHSETILIYYKIRKQLILTQMWAKLSRVFYLLL